MIAVKSNVPDLVEWIDLEQLHVHAPTTVVMVCGGRVEMEAASAVSFRDAFLRISFQSPFSKISFRLAEEADLYRPRPVYTNWKAFETDIAQLFQLVMLFCESEGSIAELATFAEIDEIARKLMVVIDNVNYHEGSYIRLGLLEAIYEKYGRSSIYVMQYDGLNIEHKGPLDTLDIAEFSRRLGDVVPVAVEKHKEPRSFDRDRAGHLIKLMIGFIQHYGALKFDEISVIFFAVGIPHEDSRIHQYIECAKFFEWISEEEVGLDTLYVATKPVDAIEYSLYPGSPKINKSTWRALVREYWREHDPNRFAVIRNAAVRM